MVMVLTGRLHDALFYGKLPVAKIFLFVGAALFFAGHGGTALRAALKTTPARAFVGVTIATIASVPFSVLKSWSLQVAFTWLYASVPIVMIVATSIRSVADLERLLRALVLMVLASTALLLAGRGVTATADGLRLSLSGQYDPNDLATVIATSGAACLWAISDRKLLWKVIGAVGLVCCGAVIVKTGSRGGAVAFAALLLGAAILLPQMLTRMTRIAILVAFVAGIAYAPSSFLDRLKTLTEVEGDYNLTATDGRIAVWTRGLGFIVRSPLVGVGAGSYAVADGRWAQENGIRGGFKWSAAHNLQIETAAELGIPGYIAMLGCVLPVIFTWRRLPRVMPLSAVDERLRRAIEAIALCTLTFLVGTFFVNGLRNPLFLILTAMSVGAHVLVRQRNLTELDQTLRAASPSARSVRKTQSGMAH